MTLLLRWDEASHNRKKHILISPRAHKLLYYKNFTFCLCLSREQEEKDDDDDDDDDVDDGDGIDDVVAFCFFSFFFFLVFFFFSFEDDDDDDERKKNERKIFDEEEQKDDRRTRGGVLFVRGRRGERVKDVRVFRPRATGELFVVLFVFFTTRRRDFGRRYGERNDTNEKEDADDVFHGSR